eukprot:3142280-Pyramimonas_sp.AAC.1
MLEDDDGFSEELERLIAQDAMEEEREDLEGANEGLDSDGKDTTLRATLEIDSLANITMQGLINSTSLTPSLATTELSFSAT